MKKLLIIIFILIIIAAGILGFALLNANKLIAQFKPQLESTVSELVGAQIELHDISATVVPETALKVSGLTIKNKTGKADSEPGLVSEAGPAFDEFLLSLKLKSLLAGKLDITKISVIAPRLTLLKSTAGIRLQGLPVPQKESENKPVQAKAEPNQSEKAKQDPASALSKLPISINLDSFELKNGSVVLEDQTANKSYTIADLNIDTGLGITGETITTSNFKLTAKILDKFPLSLIVPKISLINKDVSIESFTFSLAELAIKGSTSLNLNSLIGNAAISSDGIDIEKVLPLATDFVPVINQFGLKGSVIPNIKVNLSGPNSIMADGTIGLSKIAATQGMFGVTDLGGILTLKAHGPADVQVNSEDLNLTLNSQAINLKFLAKLLGNNFNLENFIIKLLGGSVSGNFNLGLDEKKVFSAKLQGSSISIEKALALIHSESTRLSGSVDSLSSSVNGHLGADLKESLRGNANFQLSNGELKGWNLPGLVLKAVNNLPFLTGTLYSSVPDSQRSTLDSNDTAFNSLSGSIAFIGSGISASGIKMVAPVFSLEADGKIGFDSSLDLASTILFNQNFSASLVGKLTQLKNVLDDQGQLVIPLKLQGKPPLILVYPNVKKLAEVAGKRILVNQAGEAVKGVLEKKGLGGLGGLLGF